MKRDEIHIEQLAIEAKIGVANAERAQPQRLVVSLTLVPRSDFHTLDDELARTIDYAAVADEVRAFARDTTVRLIETFADRLAAHLLARFPLREVTIELQKFVLPDARHVAVRLTRTAELPRS